MMKNRALRIKTFAGKTLKEDFAIAHVKRSGRTKRKFAINESCGHIYSHFLKRHYVSNKNYERKNRLSNKIFFI